VNLQLEQEAMRERWSGEVPVYKPTVAKPRFRILADLSLEEAIARNQKGSVAVNAQTQYQGSYRRFRDVKKAFERCQASPELELPAVSGLNDREHFVFGQFHKPGMRVIRRGWPDLFFVENGKAICVEVKASNDPLSFAQIESLSILKSLGFEIHVVIVERIKRSTAAAGGSR
jgi:VRR-NUC domain